MRKTGSLILIILLVLSLSLAGCNDANNTTGSSTAPVTAAPVTVMTTSAASTTTSATTSVTTTAVATTAVPSTTAPVQTTTAAPAIYNPLNGLTLADPSRASMRPVGVMINNIQVATAQLVIKAADMSFEMFAEGGITRMLVLFADPAKVPELGSVRSVRSDFIDFAGGVDAIIVHAGGSTYGMDQIDNQKTAHIDMHEVAEAFWRDAAWRKNRGYEHSVKTNGTRLTNAIATLKIRNTLKNAAMTAFNFLPSGEVKPAADPGTNPASTVTVEFSDYNTSTFRYDAQTKRYSKYEFGKPQIDLADNKALSVTNVVVIQTTIKSLGGTILRDANLTSGSGYYISNGARLPIKWKKGATNNPFVLTKQDGSPLQVNRGKTYVCVQSSSLSLKFS